MRGALALAVAAVLGLAMPAGATAAPEPVVLTLDATRIPGSPDGGPRVMLNGTATVPDGAYLAWELTLTDCVDAGCVKDGLVKVRDGRYQKSVRLPWTIEAAGSPAEMWVAFQTILGTKKQPKAVIRAYGKKGQRIEGPQVVRFGSGEFDGTGPLKRAEVTATLPDESSL